MNKTRINRLTPGLPQNPGVYLMKDDKNEIIYIGKAASIKKRVSSYFSSKKYDPKTSVLVKHISDIEYIITDSEIEALILESNLIKKHKPKYNIRLKDDKKYPYIAVTLSDGFPMVIFTRKLKNTGYKYFGPYTDAKAARNIISMINSIFKLKSCKKKLPLKKNERPCLNFQMKKCSGLCTNEITINEYRSLIDNAVKFLEGNIDPVLSDLNSSMNDYSKKLMFEKASNIRDIIFDIQKVSGSQKVSVPSGMDQDYLGLSIQYSEAILIQFEFRKGVLIGRKIHFFDNIKYSEPRDILKSFIIDFYKKSEIPGRIICSYRIDDREIIEKYLSDKSSKRVVLTVPESNDDRGIINMIQKNIDIIAAERNSENITGNIKQGLKELQEIFKMDTEPGVIECFDISNIQGKHAVASMVSFINGEPDKKNYRRYKIKGYDSPNDPGMIHEVVARRLQYLLNEDLSMPHLIVVDGGKTQLSRAMEVSSSLELPVKIISIAKQFEEIYFSISEKPIKLPVTSMALKIIQNIRDEAHRFAVTYHRKLRDTDFAKSELEKIPGIGSKTKDLLFIHFKSIDNIKNASIEKLKDVPGIGSKSAEIIYGYFQNVK